MKFLKTGLALLPYLCLVVAGPISKRSVLTDLATITTDVQALDTGVKSWDGTLLGAVPLVNKLDVLQTDLKTAISDTAAAAAFSQSDSTAATNSIKTLTPIITTTVNDFVSKKAQFASAGLTNIVLSSLKTLKDLSDQLATNLQAKVTSGDVAAIKAAKVTIDASFDAAIAAF
ncbi:uncharacterized protein N7500_007834 [Penicillium coprophilum]|uniref:uncharacterized protein n=1 Tax=Penicillium coprophilum TaxID=36646 RepID=UPI0023883640|nr:uncharacterized protein N7500_007834 [Penicillium coprophilum]KAJ5158183.1 hypothetical protein N7500_007834 [Penicillium coprophilum]